MDTLSNALIANIFNHLNLRDALQASYVSRGWHSMLRPYLGSTYSLYRYLSCFRDPKSLLHAFQCSGAILSGSRALSYFLPSHRMHTETSDWDIFVPSPYQEFLHQELLSQGFQSVIRTKAPRKPELFCVFDYRNSANVKVQVVALTAQWSLYACLMDFHMSVVQNFISGWGCVSVYSESTFAKRGWLAARLNSFSEYQDEVIREMDVKGIKLVRWKEKESVKCPSDSVFVVYLPRARNGCGHAYISLEELEKELVASVQY